MAAPPRDRKRVARYVESRRAALGLTQQQLADRAAVDLKTVYNLEVAGRWPQAKNRHKLETALRWTDGDFVRIAEGGEPVVVDFADQEAPAGAEDFEDWVQANLHKLSESDRQVVEELLTEYQGIKESNARMLEKIVVLFRQRTAGGRGNDPGAAAAE
jgi:transcriptional regulator with XRE-family HTH domain